MYRMFVSLLLALCATAHAQQTYPTKTVRLIVPLVAGGPTDILARLLGTRLGEVLGQPFVKDDKQTVGQYLGQAGGEVTSFTRFEVGAGIEKKQEDFAAEVMKQAGLDKST